MDIIRKIRISRLTADTLNDPNVPNYIKAGFKTELDFLKWLCPKDRHENNIEEYRKWEYKSRGQVLEIYDIASRKAHGLPLNIPVDGSGSFVVPSGKHIEY